MPKSDKYMLRYIVKEAARREDKTETLEFSELQTALTQASELTKELQKDVKSALRGNLEEQIRDAFEEKEKDVYTSPDKNPIVRVMAECHDLRLALTEAKKIGDEIVRVMKHEKADYHKLDACLGDVFQSMKEMTPVLEQWEKIRKDGLHQMKKEDEKAFVEKAGHNLKKGLERVKGRDGKLHSKLEDAHSVVKDADL